MHQLDLAGDYLATVVLVEHRGVVQVVVLRVDRQLTDQKVQLGGQILDSVLSHWALARNRCSASTSTVSAIQEAPHGFFGLFPQAILRDNRHCEEDQERCRRDLGS